MHRQVVIYQEIHAMLEWNFQYIAILIVSLNEIRAVGTLFC